MITATTRPLTWRERWHLRAMSKASAEDTIFVPFLTLCGVTVLLAGSVLLLKSRVLLIARYENPIMVAAFVVALLVACLVRKNNLRMLTPPSLDEDRKAGMAEVLTIEPVEAVRVQQLEDEGTGFFIAVGDSQVLFLQDQELDPLDARQEFPSTQFQLVRSSVSKAVLGLKCLGTYMAPSETIGPFTHKDHDAGRVPDSGAVLTVDIEKVKEQGRTRASNATARKSRRGWSGHSKRSV